MVFKKKLQNQLLMVFQKYQNQLLMDAQLETAVCRSPPLSLSRLLLIIQIAQF